MKHMDLSDDGAFPLCTPTQIHIPWFTWMCLSNMDDDLLSDLPLGEVAQIPGVLILGN